jgi:cysteine desulfurase
VLEAMGVLTHGNVRVSMSEQTTAEDVERLLDVIATAVPALRRLTGAEGL